MIRFHFRQRPASSSPLLPLLTFFAAACLCAPAALASEALVPLSLRNVQVGGEIGRRITVTMTNNLLVLDADRDFLPPFMAKTAKDGYIGLGKLMDVTVKFAANTGDPRVLALKQHLVEETLRAQEPDGYIGIIAPSQRVRGLWDIHEMGYVIWALLTEYEFFGDQRSLTAARKAGDYLTRNWSALPKDWGQQTSVAPQVAVTGIERTMLALHRQTGAAFYLDFCVKTRALPEWDLPIVIGRRQGIEGHIYAYMARCLAQLELYRIQPSRHLFAQTDRALDFMLHHDGLHYRAHDGLGCRVRAWKPGFGLGKKGDFALTLTEFPDPDGKATYFRLRDFSVAVDDELFADKAK